MSALILIVDDVPESRIVVRVKLATAQYRVNACPSVAEARPYVARHRPDLVLLDVSGTGGEALAFCAEIKQAYRDAVTVIALGAFVDSRARLAALAEGADDLLEKPVDEALLQARIRSLLRMRDDEAELRLREDTGRALGHFEAAEPDSRDGRIVIVAPGPEVVRSGTTLLPPRIADRCCRLTTRAALRDESGADAPDLYVIDARCMIEGEIFRLVPELRSRPGTRHAAQLVIMPRDGDGLAAMMLDLGANAVVHHDVGTEELTFRAEALLRRKRRQDRLRDTLRDGLEAAVSDPLTGLHNRRYALPHLDRMIDHARSTQRPLALMMLDLDHFKAINDRWGHKTGDDVLVEVAARLRQSLRPKDLVARIGGEEFLIAMPDTTSEQARRVAERLCQAIEARPVPATTVHGELSVTVSIGVALGGWGPHQTGEVGALVERADAALYAAKTAGRNTVTMSLSAA